MPAAADVDQAGQRGVGGDLVDDLGGRAEVQPRGNLGHGQADRAVALELQHQRAVELDPRAHQHAGRGHLAEQQAHWGGEGTDHGAATQRLAPARREAHQRAAHGCAIEREAVEVTGAHGRSRYLGRKQTRLSQRMGSGGKPARCRAGILADAQRDALRHRGRGGTCHQASPTSKANAV